MLHIEGAGIAHEETGKHLAICCEYEAVSSTLTVMQARVNM